MVSAKLAIGAVQFGKAYGATNRRGIVPTPEVADILETAASSLPNLLIDTAPAYGDSEAIIGRCLEARGINAAVVTKTSPEPGPIEAALAMSLSKLRLSRVYGLVDHNAEMLLGSGGDAAFAALERLKDNGLVEKIGASVYTAAQIDCLLARYALDVVQVPVSLFDQRLIEREYLWRLKERQIEVHARSVFLQGLLLSKPEFLAPQFCGLKPAIQALREASRAEGVSPLRAALGFVLGQSHIDRVVVGVTSRAEFDEILLAAEPYILGGSSRLAVSDDRLIDPSRWSL